MDKFITLTRYTEEMKEHVTKFDFQGATVSWTKMRDFIHTLKQFLLQQNRFGTGENDTIQREEGVRRHAGGMPMLIGLCLAMKIDPLVLIRVSVNL